MAKKFDLYKEIMTYTMVPPGGWEYLSWDTVIVAVSGQDSEFVHGICTQNIIYFINLFEHIYIGYKTQFR